MSMRHAYSPLFLIALALAFTPIHAEPPEVGITATMDRVEVLHEGEPVFIQRDQDTFNIVTPDFSMTSRPCPPYCIQPMSAGPGIETLGELELIDYLQRSGEDDSIVVIDSRTAQEYARGTIPGAVNLPWDRLHFGSGADPMQVEGYLEDFGVIFDGSFHDFSQAKTLVLFCNGPWCGQSPTNLRTLTNLGYPAERLKWYRGGMQLWHLLGLTVINP
ncbi:rhodanese-like domain-containing protein [Thioalkalivibrio sp.]|uniref:rhodanese-like domain-containing protein n=1 Tax=Thioalkalivibrio sp. TaxID=2093813 RepID=UPI0012D65FF1|nr:rhodanese-like domain-containing protein [Thioalkalivibrio sp.]TVP77322.1 MAG: rhodanese-like domain-containing protein [Thioalkalivibrio sp.]